MAGIFISLILWASCEQFPDEPEQGIDRAHPLIVQTGYTTVRITDNGAVSRAVQDVWRLGFGTAEADSFIEQSLRPPQWTKADGSWFLSFDETMTIPDNVLFATVRVRMYLTSGESYDVDERIPTTRYPYAENEILVSTDIFASTFYRFQDIAVVDTTLYVLTLGPTSIWEVDLTTHEARMMLATASGDHIAAADSEVFIDVGHDQIYRWNGIANDLGQKIWGDPTSGYDLWGLAAEDGNLYALLIDRSWSNEWLLTMDYSGTIIDSASIRTSSEFYTAVHGGILHIVHNEGYDEDPFLLYRYDIASRTWLAPFLTPSRWVEGIAIHNGFLYYIDFVRDVVGRVRIDQLREATMVTLGHAAPSGILLPDRTTTRMHPDAVTR